MDHRRPLRPVPLLALLLLGALVGGCAAVAPDRLQHDPRFAIPEGSTLVLNHAIELPGAGDLLYLQHGRTSGLAGVQEVYPHCYVETWERPDGPLVVPPTAFTITGVERSFNFSWLPATHEGRLVKVSTGGDGDGGSALSQWFYITRLQLEPADPTVDVYRLTCLADRLDAQGPATETHHLTVAQIREALGEVFSLRLKGG